MLIYSSKPLRPVRPHEHPPLDARNPASILAASNTSNASNIFLIGIGNIKEVRDYGEYRAVARPWPRGSKPYGRTGRIGRNNSSSSVINGLSCVQCKRLRPLRPIYLDAGGISCVRRIGCDPFSRSEPIPPWIVQSVGFPRASRWGLTGIRDSFNPSPRTDSQFLISILFTPELGLNLGPKRRVPAKCAIRHARTGQPMGWRIRTPFRFTDSRPKKSLLSLDVLNGSHQDGKGEWWRRWHRRSEIGLVISSTSSSRPSHFLWDSSRQKFSQFSQCPQTIMKG
jgi:hypothetical protein